MYMHVLSLPLSLPLSLSLSRLSSLSSVDLQSPEPMDAFHSPPLTPSLSTTSLQDLTPSSTNITSPPWGSLSKLSFEVTPYLHPKYLLAGFALPRKKVWAYFSLSLSHSHTHSLSLCIFIPGVSACTYFQNLLSFPICYFFATVMMLCHTHTCTCIHVY